MHACRLLFVSLKVRQTSLSQTNSSFAIVSFIHYGSADTLPVLYTTVVLIPLIAQQPPTITITRFVISRAYDM